jgi:hypothetical protein
MPIRPMRYITTLLLGIVILTSTTPASAHHAFAAEFDANKKVTFEGVLTKVAWFNPHGWIYVDVTKDSKVTNWAIEFGSPNALLRRGLRRTDFPPGVTVKVTGYLAKNGTPTVNAESVTLPDGRTLFTGSSNPAAEGAAR